VDRRGREGTRVVFPAATRSKKVTKATLEPAGQGKNELSKKRRRRRRRSTPADIANKRDTRR